MYTLWYVMVDPPPHIQLTDCPEKICKLIYVLTVEITKGQLNSEWIYEVIVFFPKCQQKITKISALEVY